MVRLSKTRLVQRFMRTLAVAERQLIGTRSATSRSLPTPDPSHAWCHRCGVTLRGTMSMPCGSCAGMHLERDRTIRLGAYETHARASRAHGAQWRDAILAVKHGRDRILARELGELLARQLLREIPAMSALGDHPMIVPVPMPLARRIERGIDHADEIARSVARVLGVPLMRCLMHDAGPAQAQLSQSQRRFRPDRIHWRRRSKAEPLSMSTILLVDDVLTTGSTLSQASRSIRQQLGPISIVGLVVAVADPSKTTAFTGISDCFSP